MLYLQMYKFHKQVVCHKVSLDSPKLFPPFGIRIYTNLTNIYTLLKSLQKQFPKTGTWMHESNNNLAFTFTAAVSLSALMP